MPARLCTVLMMTIPALFVGCHHTPTDAPTNNLTTAPQIPAEPADASLTFHPDQYPRVHRAAIEALRDHGFEIARDDYRFGVITTKPKEAPTAVEFWIDDPTTPAQHRADTLNAHQRRVTIRVQRDMDPDDAASGVFDPPTEGGQVPRYRLTAQVMTDRLQRSGRYLTHSATPRISADTAGPPAQLRARGIEGDYAQPLTRDPQLEARLVNAIASRARALAKIDALQSTAPPDPSE